MRVVVQRVKAAWVDLDCRRVAEIGVGLLGLVGFGRGDGWNECEWMAEKLTGLRIFPDASSKTMGAVGDIGGGILLVSQFTLYASTMKGRRPDYRLALPRQEAETLYAAFLTQVQSSVANTVSGVFGADMDVGLINWGPITVLLEKNGADYPVC